MTEQARCLKARYYKGASNHAGQDSGIAIPVLTPDRAEKRQNGRRFKEDGEPMFTLTGQDRHGIAIEVKEATKQGYAECRVGIDSVNFSMPNSKTRRGRAGQEIANTLDTSCNQGIFVQVSEELVVYAVWYEKYQCYIAIRKLTPKECFRLQGWTDDYFEKAEFVNSDSQLYKQAGNGVTVTVIEAMDMTVTNVLVAADLVILPVKVGGFEIEAIVNMEEQLEDLRGFNPDIRMKLLMTMRQKNMTSLQVEEWLKASSGQDCFQTAIRRSIVAEKATMERVPLPKFSKSGIVAKDYREVAEELLKDMEG